MSPAPPFLSITVLVQLAFPSGVHTLNITHDYVLQDGRIHRICFSLYTVYRMLSKFFELPSFSCLPDADETVSLSFCYCCETPPLTGQKMKEKTFAYTTTP